MFFVPSSGSSGGSGGGRGWSLFLRNVCEPATASQGHVSPLGQKISTDKRGGGGTNNRGKTLEEEEKEGRQNVHTRNTSAAINVLKKRGFVYEV